MGQNHAHNLSVQSSSEPTLNSALYVQVWSFGPPMVSQVSHPNQNLRAKRQLPPDVSPSFSIELSTPRPEMPGSLRCYNFPLTGDYVEYQAVSLSISAIRQVNLVELCRGRFLSAKLPLSKSVCSKTAPKPKA